MTPIGMRLSKKDILGYMTAKIAQNMKQIEKLHFCKKNLQIIETKSRITQIHFVAYRHRSRRVREKKANDKSTTILYSLFANK